MHYGDLLDGSSLRKIIEKVIGTTVVETYFDFNARRQDTRSMTVIGVVKDFPYKSMHQAIGPLLLNPHLHSIDRIAYIKLPSGKFQEKIAAIEKVAAVAANAISRAPSQAALYRLACSAR